MKYFIACLFGILLTAGLGQAAPGLPILKNVNTLRAGNDFISEFTFSEKVSDKDIALEYINNTIETVIPNVRILKAKSLYPVADSTVRNVFVARLPGNSIRVRVNLNPGQAASGFRDFTQVSSVDNKVIVKVIGAGVQTPNPSGEIVSRESETTVAGIQTGVPSGKMIDQLMADSSSGPVDLEKDLAAREESKGEGAQLPATQSSKDSTTEIKQASAGASTAAAASGKSTNALPTKVEKANHGDEESRPVFEGKAESKVAPVTKNTYSRMLLSLVVVLGLFGASAWAYKKWPVRKAAGKPHMIQILSQAHLGPKKTLAVVRVAGETVLIGITDNNISLLKSLSLLDEDIPEVTPDQFQNTLTAQARRSGDSNVEMTTKGHFNDLADASTGRGVAEDLAENVEDQFSMRGIQNLVGQKLKNMRSI